MDVVRIQRRVAGTAVHRAPGRAPSHPHPGRSVLDLQGAVGNRAVRAALAAPVQRAEPDPTAPEQLKKGAKGPAVEEVQQHLNRHGASPELKVDGDFGPKTKAATKRFQASHQHPESNEQLASDGIIGPMTWRALQTSVASALPAGATKHPVDEATELFAKGAAMTPAEATRAQAVLFSLDGDEFRKVIKAALTSGAFMAMLGKLDAATIITTVSQLRHEVVVPTTLLKPAPDTIATDFARANAIYNPKGIEIERGTHIELSEKATTSLLGADASLDEFPTTAPLTATAEELELVEMNRNKARVSAYWIPKMTSSRGEALVKRLIGNLPDDRESVVVDANARAQDTFPHELGHALGLDHDLDANNLMADGNIRNIAGTGIDKLTDDQIKLIRSSLVVEVGKQGLGK